MKPKHQRLLFVAASVGFLCLAALFTLQAFRSNIVYFYSPTELASMKPGRDKLIRIGGLIKPGSIVRSGQNRIQFVLTDKNKEIHVAYDGMLPGLFREQQGVIAEGHLILPDTFQATTVLTKHDEKYMPKDVVDALKRQGRWHEDEQ